MWLWKESLSSDGHQFNQYQQNKQSPLLRTEPAEHKKTTTWNVGNPGLDLEPQHNCGGVKPVNGIPTLPSWLLVFGYRTILLFASIFYWILTAIKKIEDHVRGCTW